MPRHRAPAAGKCPATGVPVADDQPAFHCQLGWLFTRAGSLVFVQLSSILETWVRAHAHEPDPVVVDLMLPAVNGIEGLARLKALAPDL